jgi:signal transduction histidine kinase
MVIGLGINSSNYVKDRLKAQRQIITVQEHERERIGRDLHDEVGNSLAAVKNMLAQRRDPLLIEKEIDDVIQDIRNISHDLMPVDFKKYALADIVRQTVKKFKGYPGIQFEYSQTGRVTELHPVTELVLYRIVNELITNSIKHSRATSVMIQLIYQTKSLLVMVEDNGTGMKNDADMREKKGIGLQNIRHRVAYIRATLTIESDNRGTLFIIEIPYEKQLHKIPAHEKKR